MVNWFLPKCKVQSVEMFISPTDTTRTTEYLPCKMIALIYNSQDTEQLPQNGS